MLIIMNRVYIYVEPQKAGYKNQNDAKNDRLIV